MPARFKFILTLLIISLAIDSSAQRELPLYDKDIPNSIASQNTEQKKANPVVDTLTTNVSIPSITVFPAMTQPKGIAVIIFPGGGYQVLLTKREGSDVAKALNKYGITTFVVKYRLPSDKTMRDKTMGPLQDAQQAIKLVRENANKWNINPDKIGIMGFSAGGHLAATAGTHFEHTYVKNPKNISVRPDFMILINPLISFTDSLGHKGSTKFLLGDSPPETKIQFFSNELHVTKSTPSTILIHTNQDSVVTVENSLRFYQALKRNNVPSEIHIYSKGEHGFLTAPPFNEWFGRCIYWINENLLHD
ncbi:MAG: alpha/beta hydrolase [Cyclobacteriaceae bacterium]